MLINKKNLIPLSSFEEKTKKLLTPGELNLNHLERKNPKNDEDELHLLPFLLIESH